MAQDLISSYVDRDGIKGDTKFILDEINKALTAVKEFNAAKPSFEAAKGYEATGQAIKKQKEAQENLATSSAKLADAQGRTAQALKETVNSINTAAVNTETLTDSYDELIKLSVQNQLASKGLSAARKELDKSFRDGIITADEYTDTLEQIKKKEVEITVSNLELNRAIRNTEKGYQAAGGSLNELRSQLNLSLQAFDRLDEVDRETDIGQGLKKNIQELTARISEQEQSTGRFQRNVGNYSGAVKTLEKALTEVRAKLDDYNKSGKASADVIESLTREEGLLAQLVNNQVNGFASATAEVKNNEKALQALQNAGLQTSAYYKQLLEETADLKDNVNDLKATIKNLGSDTRTFDGLIQGAQTLAGVYGIAQGAAALFGEENEDLQKTFVKLQAVQTILAGIQGVQNALQKESSVMLLLNTVRTGALTLAQKAYTFATGGATVAARAFNTALLATGIGAAVVLITTIASAMSNLGDETDDTAKSTRELAEEVDNLNQKYLEMADADEKVKNAAKGKLDDLRRELQLQEAAGDSDSKRFETKQKILKEELFNLIRRRASITENGKIEVDLDRQIADKKNEIRAEQLAFDKKSADDAAKIAKERADKGREFAERERKARFEIFKLEQQDRINAQKAFAEADTPLTSVRVKARLQQFEEERKLVIAQKEFELSQEGLTASQRELIIKNSNKTIADLERSSANDIITIRKSAADQLKQDEAQANEFVKGEIDKQTAKEIDSINKGFEARINAIEDQSVAELKALSDQYSAGLISKEQFEEGKLAIENKQRRESLLAEIDHQQKLLEILNLPEDEKLAAQKKLASLRRDLQKTEIDDEQKLADKKLEIQKKLNEKLKELGNELKETAFAFLTGGIEREKNEIQEQIDALEEKKQKDIEVANQSIANATERANAIAVIEARAGAERERLERRKRQLDQERARYERLKNIADIIQSTAVAVVNALGSKPWTPANIAIAAAVGAIGAAQIARVLATPIPKFYGGKSKEHNYEGPAWVDDGGKPEAILRQDGSVEIGGNKPRITYLKRGDVVLPDARQLIEHDFRLAVSKTGQLVNIQPKTQSAPNNRDVVRSLKSLENTVRNKKETKIIVQNPIKSWIGSNHSWNQYLNL